MKTSTDPADVANMAQQIGERKRQYAADSNKVYEQRKKKEEEAHQVRIALLILI